ncbi:MAG: hypothetical protein ACPLVF_02070 [Thermovenabulum sp.]|uniref:hypothetical protein n=1 Tax=Thermovenabulum sp. TaxID=3100335 RepID=UPI003C7C9E8B
MRLGILDEKDISLIEQEKGLKKALFGENNELKEVQKIINGTTKEENTDEKIEDIIKATEWRKKYEEEMKKLSESALTARNDIAEGIIKVKEGVKTYLRDEIIKRRILYKALLLYQTSIELMKKGEEKTRLMLTCSAEKVKSDIKYAYDYSQKKVKRFIEKTANKANEIVALLSDIYEDVSEKITSIYKEIGDKVVISGRNANLIYKKAIITFNMAYEKCKDTIKRMTSKIREIRATVDKKVMLILEREKKDVKIREKINEIYELANLSHEVILAKGKAGEKGNINVSPEKYVKASIYDEIISEAKKAGGENELLPDLRLYSAVKEYILNKYAMSIIIKSDNEIVNEKILEKKYGIKQSQEMQTTKEEDILDKLLKEAGIIEEKIDEEKITNKNKNVYRINKKL